MVNVTFFVPLSLYLSPQNFSQLFCARGLYPTQESLQSASPLCSIKGRRYSFWNYLNIYHFIPLYNHVIRSSSFSQQMVSERANFFLGLKANGSES